jgi:hypothetical protein
VLDFTLEVREFLLVERRVDYVGEVGRMVAQALSASPGPRAAFLGSYLDSRTIKALVQALPAGGEIPAALLELVDLAPAETHERLLAMLGEGGPEPQTAMVRALAARAFRGASQTLASRLRQAQGESAAALLQVLAEMDPTEAPRRALEAARSTDTTLQAEAARLLARLPPSAESARMLQHLADAPFEEVRVEALPALARGGARAFSVLSALCDKRSVSLGPAEAEALGRALIEANPRSALGLFDGWLQPKSGGLLGRGPRMHVPPPLQRAALAGLRIATGAQADALLQLLATHGEPAIAQAAAATLQARGGRHV